MTLAEWVQDVKGDAEKIVRGLFNNLQLVSNKEDSGNPICIFPRKKHTKGPVRSEASACLSCIIKRMTHPDHRCHDRMWKDAFVSNICYDCSTVGFSKTCMNVYDFESISELPSSIITLYCRLARTRRLAQRPFGDIAVLPGFKTMLQEFQKWCSEHAHLRPETTEYCLNRNGEGDLMPPPEGGLNCFQMRRQGRAEQDNTYMEEYKTAKPTAVLPTGPLPTAPLPTTNHHPGAASHVSDLGGVIDHYHVNPA